MTLENTKGTVPLQLETTVLCNTAINGGGEQSAQWIADQLGCKVTSLTTDEWKNCKAKKQIWYMNNSIYGLLNDVREFRSVLDYAQEIYVVLNFVLGGFERQKWIEQYPVKKVIFLNETKHEEYLTRRIDGQRDIPTAMLPPPVDIDKYLSIERDYDRDKLTIGRHSRISLKYPDNPAPMYKMLRKGTEADFSFMIAHKNIVKEFSDDKRFKFYGFDEVPVSDFLESIDIYLSIIHPNTKDQGPRTLMEAMASGLPCIVEDRDGMRDRMISGLTGYLVESEEEAIKRAIELCDDKEKRIKMGQAARKTAASFRPEKWLKELHI